VTPGLKYTLARVGVFIACTLPAVLFLPKSLDLLPRILIGFVLSAIVSFTLLRRWRDEMAQQIADGVQQRREEKNKLRAALAGEDEGDAPAES
jgi:Protein of unknown function (DUF4229)